MRVRNDSITPSSVDEFCSNLDHWKDLTQEIDFKRKKPLKHQNFERIAHFLLNLDDKSVTVTAYLSL